MTRKQEKLLVKILLLGYLIVASLGVYMCGREPSYIPPVEESPLEVLHRSFLLQKEASSVYEPEGSFLLGWSYPDAARDTINGFIVERSGEAVERAEPWDSVWVDCDVLEKVRYFYTIRAYKVGLDGDTTWTAEELYMWLEPENDPYYSDDLGVIYFSAASDTVSGAWAKVGPDVKEREWAVRYDSLWSKRDMLKVSVPVNHPYTLDWQKEPFEAVIWKGLLDLTGNCWVGLSDLTYFSENYNRSACDSVAFEE